MVRTRLRRRALSLAVVGSAIFAIVAPVVCLVQTAPASAANPIDFNPSMIISDALFYDNQAMTTPQIQQFLDQQIGACLNGSCLNVAVVNFSGAPKVVSSRTGNTQCEAVAGGQMSVAELIGRVQLACDISAKVILTTLQKEQGLVTDRAPSDSALQRAMGMACPDTAPCDSAFSGLATQIYTGTLQLNTYKSARFGKQPGANYIQYNPNAGCGGSTLNIANYATAALYNYTPYQPNDAALANLYGTGNGCSSYGNRNFWRLYSDWFGSTNGASADLINSAWLFTGGDAGSLGAATSGFTCGLLNAGCFKWFQNGLMYASLNTPAVAVAGQQLALYLSLGAHNGWLGYPVLPLGTGLQNGGSYQVFQGGSIYTSPGGTWAVHGSIGADWTTLAKEWGPAGYPISAETCGLFAGGCSQDFEHGRIYWSLASGAHFVPTTSQKVLDDSGGAGGWLGYPVTEVISGLQNGGSYQVFQQGAVYASGAGTWPVHGSIQQSWSLTGNESGAAGYPTSGETPSIAGGVYQQFERGRIYWSLATGAQFVPSAAVTALTAFGSLGYPLTGSTCGLTAGGCYQVFQTGALYTSSNGTWPVWGAVRYAWALTGNEWGALGYPTSVEAPIAGGVYQAFERGRIYWSPITGAHAVPSNELGATGALGFPIADQSCGLVGGGCYQVFQNGAVYTSPSGVWPVWGAIRAAWATVGNEWGSAGYPISGETSATGGGVYQAFEHGRIYWSPRVGAQFVPEPILTAYVTAGAEAGAYGFPVGPAHQVGATMTQLFQGGVISVG